MIDFHGRKARGIALIAGGAVATMALAPATARAEDSRDKEKAYKTGAAVLGAASALLILKGKSIEGALAGAGAYYAYKKGQEIKQEREQYPDYDVYSQYPGDSRYPGETYYPDSYPTDTYPEYSTYPDYRAPEDYDYRGDYRGGRRGGSRGDVYAGADGYYGAPAYVAPRGAGKTQQNRPDVRLK